MSGGIYELDLTLEQHLVRLLLLGTAPAAAAAAAATGSAPARGSPLVCFCVRRPGAFRTLSSARLACCCCCFWFVAAGSQAALHTGQHVVGHELGHIEAFEVRLAGQVPCVREHLLLLVVVLLLLLAAAW
jgi:hypothetical protein